jgi:hypothetical protein
MTEEVAKPDATGGAQDPPPQAEPVGVGQSSPDSGPASQPERPTPSEAAAAIEPALYRLVAKVGNEAPGTAARGGVFRPGRNPPDLRESTDPPSAEPQSPPGKRYGSASSTGSYSPITEGSVSRTKRKPTDAALASLRQLLAKSPVVGVISRAGAREIATHAVVEPTASERKLWRVQSDGPIAVGDITHICTHLDTLTSESNRLLWVEARAEPKTEGDVLTTLFTDGKLRQLREALEKRDAQIVFVFGYDEETEPRFAYDGFAEACADWLYEAPWFGELAAAWKQTSKGKEVEKDSGMITRWERQVEAERARFPSDSALWGAMLEFQTSAIEGPVAIGQLDERFAEALAAARSGGRNPQWLKNIEDILATPPDKKLLQKLLIALTTLLNTGAHAGPGKDSKSEALTYLDLRRFGCELLHDDTLPEGRTKAVEERKTSTEGSTRTRTRVTERVSAREAWYAHLDHLAREVGLRISSVDDQLRVDFSDAYRRSRVFSLLRDSYPSVVLDLLGRLWTRNWLFHYDPVMRELAWRCLRALWDFDKGHFTQLGDELLERADKLMRTGPRVAEDITHEIDDQVFKDRKHAVCLIEFYQQYSSCGISAGVLQESLVPQSLWNTNPVEDADRVVLRTQVCLGLRGFTGMGALARRIDRAPAKLFEPLLKMVSESVDHDAEIVRLEAVSPWLSAAEDRSDTVSRSRVLAEQIWVNALTRDARAMGSKYDPDARPRTLGLRFVEAKQNVQRLWPALLHVRWAQTHVVWFDLKARLRDMFYLLLFPPVDTPASDAVDRHEELLFESAAEVLLRASNREIPDFGLFVDHPDTAADLQSLEELFAKAREVSSDDPKTLEYCLRAVLKAEGRAESSLPRLVQQLSRITDYFAEPLRLFSGLLVAHWCFHRTGVEVGARFREGEDADTERRTLGKFLDSLTTALADQPEPYGAKSLVWQWGRLVRVLRGLAAEVVSLEEIEREPRDDLFRMLKHKEKKLMMLKTGLEKRIAAAATGV